MANDWKMHGALHSHREQVELNVRAKLKASRQKERQLTPDRALEGARALALAALLMRRLTFKHGGDSDTEGAPDAVVDPTDILASWTQDEHRALLERPLFGHASYGRVRFHHRSVIEYLAAEQLHALHLAGLPDRDLSALLFARTPEGIRVVKPSMRPTAVWMAAQSPMVFSELIDREPQALLQYGDPATLASGDRLLALRAYVRLAAKRQWEGTDFALEQIQRIATDDVIAELPPLWRTGVTNPDVRKLLLQLLAVRPTEEGTDIAAQVVGDTGASPRERALAARALVARNDPRVTALAHDIAHNGAQWNREAAVAVALELVPDAMTPGEVCTLLDRLPPKARTNGGELAWHLSALARNGDATGPYLDGVLDGLVTLVVCGLVWDDENWPRLRTTRDDLVAPILAICNARMDAGHLTTPLLCAAVIAGQLAHNAPSLNSELDELRARVHAWPAGLRRVCFFVADALHQGIHPETESWSRFIAINSDGLLRLDSAIDSGWMMDVVADVSLSGDVRALGLEPAMRGLFPDGVTPTQQIKRLAAVVGDDPMLAARLDGFAKHPRDSTQIRRYHAENLRFQQQRAAREEKQRQAWVDFWTRVANDPASAFGPDRVNNTARNLWAVMQNVAEPYPNSGWNRSFLETHFSASLADRMRSALMPLWRAERPTLPRERGETERLDSAPGWSLGATAIAAESEDPAWARKLSAVEAALAARYVPVDVRFPAWFLSLAEAHPVPVLDTLAPELDGELDAVFGPNEHGWFVQNVASAPPPIRELFIGRIEAWFARTGPTFATSQPAIAPPYPFQRVIRLLARHGQAETRALLEEVAARALEGPLDEAWTLQWFATLFALNPDRATDQLEAHLSTTRPKKLGAGARLMAGLFGDRYENQRVNPKDPSFTPQTALRLTRLAYTHVRRKDDSRRIGTYTPDVRDAAETGRGAVLGALLDSDGPGAWDAKVTFSKDPLIGGFRDRAVSIATEHAANASEGPALTAAQLRAVLAATAMPPMTRDQMFVMLGHRLDDLEERMRSDTSPREGLALIGKEYIMRRALAHELETMARKAYIIDQESVSGEEKEMDIRLISTMSRQAGVIELKLGDKWTGTQLRDTIEHQLVRRYMAPDDRKAGCLLVTVSKPGHWAHPVTGTRLDVTGLRQMLVTEATRVANALGNAVRIDVRVIDLSPPPRTGPKPASANAKPKSRRT
jgi:hypothetical protein